MPIEVPCCPPLEQDEVCDRLDFKYSLTHRPVVAVAGAPPRVVPVEVTIHVRIERCRGPLALGDIAYTTTLLPGEKVRLFTTDRRSRFMFDSETKVSYRHAQASEEQFYMSSFAREMSDLTITETGAGSSHIWGDWGADLDSYYASAIFAGTAGGSIEGHYDDQSTFEFLKSLKSHAENSHYRSEMATRTSSAISIGEVASRTHAEGQSEDHFESSSRVFSNPNRCHAVTFYFYRIHRLQTIKVVLVAIERRIKDPAAATSVVSRPVRTPSGVSVMPTGVLGTASDRLEVEARAEQSVVAKLAAVGAAAPTAGGAAAVTGTVPTQTLLTALRAQAPEPIPLAVREQALKQVDEQLVKVGLLTAVAGQVSPAALKEFFFELQSSLPTPGILVKGCLDECDICEPALQKQIELELERKQLENDMLKKQIDLLEKSQEYRCCPKGYEEIPTP